MTVIQLEGVRERSLRRRHRSRHGEPAARTRQHHAVCPAQPALQVRPKESVGQEFVGQDRFGSRDGSQLNPKTLREFVGQEWFGPRDGVSTAQPREQARSHSSPGLAMRHPEAVYRRRRLVLVSVIGAVLTILLAVGRPETLPGHEFPAQEQPIWPTVQLHDLSVYTGAPETSLWGTAVEVGTGRGT